MRIRSPKHSLAKQDIIHVLILLAIALGIGIYLIATTVVIAKDGVTFIEYAKGLEADPAKTMAEQDQHPGYPAVILGVHKITKFICESKSVYSWICSAQSTALMFRLFAIVVLYFVGRYFVGSKFSFWAVLILVLLPKPAKYGSDALSDWPHLFYLAAGMFLLIRAAMDSKWWLFGFAGLAAGLGYLVRPECAQVIIYGGLWLVWQLFARKRILDRPKTVLALAFLLIGFLAIAGPYMKLKGAIFPKKQIGQLTSTAHIQQQPHSSSKIVCTALVTPPRIVNAIGELIEECGDTFMWFFAPLLIIGFYDLLRRRVYDEPAKFFIAVLIGLNIPLMIWLYCKYGYISGRHVLPLAAFTVFCVPAGLEALASWLQKKLSKESCQADAKDGGANFWFIFLAVTGIAVCTPKLLRPLHQDKLIFRKAAQWLANNTTENDLLAVPDLRISFYSGRKGADYKHQAFAKNAQYVVRVSKNNGSSHSEELPKPSDILYTDKSNEKYKVDIYKPLNQALP
jgi:4-amino-4-deoxy-L-arabinose transferase-like glycosyltransferase